MSLYSHWHTIYTTRLSRSSFWVVSVVLLLDNLRKIYLGSMIFLIQKNKNLKYCVYGLAFFLIFIFSVIKASSSNINFNFRTRWLKSFKFLIILKKPPKRKYKELPFWEDKDLNGLIFEFKYHTFLIQISYFLL